MDISHNNSNNSSPKLLARYLFSRTIYSVILTIFMLFLTYKDILYLRFMSGTVGDINNSSLNIQNLLFDRFSYNLNNAVAKNIPVFLIIIMVFMVIYSVYFSYKKTYTDLSVNQNNIHIKKRSPERVLINSILIRAGVFAIPLLFWFYYIFIWFPFIVKIPLMHILGGQILSIITYTSVMFISLVLLTQIGLVISNIAIRYLKKT